MSEDLKPGDEIQDADPRMHGRSGRVLEVKNGYARVSWSTGRITTISLHRVGSNARGYRKLEEK